MSIADSITLSACLFGSFYLCSTSLALINYTYIENTKIPKALIVINGLTFIMTGSLVIYTFKALSDQKIN